MHFQRPFGAESPDAVWMRADDFRDASMNDEEVVDETFEAATFDSAQRAYGFPTILLYVVQEMHPVFVGIRCELEEADAAALSRWWL